MRHTRRIPLVALAALAMLLPFASSKANAATDSPREPFVEAQLGNYSTDELLEYLSLESINWQYTTYKVEDLGWKIAHELVRRKDTDKLINAFEHPVDDLQEEMVARALSWLDDDKTYPVFKKTLLRGSSRKSTA